MKDMPAVALKLYQKVLVTNITHCIVSFSIVILLKTDQARVVAEQILGTLLELDEAALAARLLARCRFTVPAARGQCVKRDIDDEERGEAELEREQN